jgi:hypothetical protein
MRQRVPTLLCYPFFGLRHGSGVVITYVYSAELFHQLSISLLICDKVSNHAKRLDHIVVVVATTLL